MQRGRVHFAVLIGAAALASVAGCASNAATPHASQASRTSSYAVRICPSKPLTQLRPPHIPGAAKRLIPFVPTGLTVCHYGAIPSKPQSTVRDDGTKAVAIAVRLNSNRKIPPTIVNCPADSGERADLYFSNTTTRIAIQVYLSGCGIIQNGSTGRLANTGSAGFRTMLGLSAQPDPFSTGP
jgi:hypothetical protein